MPIAASSFNVRSRLDHRANDTSNKRAHKDIGIHNPQYTRSQVPVIPSDE